jgi:hypothetical protein
MFLAVVSRVWLTLGEVMIVALAGALLWYRQSAPRGTR